jgi:hypothetical protein
VQSRIGQLVELDYQRKNAFEKLGDIQGTTQKYFGKKAQMRYSRKETLF